ncbi:MAG: type II/IV secretion system protein [Verrucomicrobiales bacterium]|nr:type II/IV secretion system protein [Verrucomicrobiales bacterium]
MKRREPDTQTPLLARLLQEVLALLEQQDQGTRGGDLVQALVQDAHRERASDIHLDPDSSGYRLQFRIDGVIVPVLSLPKDQGTRLVRSLKSLADLEPAAARVPRDGRAHVMLGDRSLGLRVATAPAVSGEKLAVRLLPHELFHLGLDELGLSPQDYALVCQSLQDARGMILLSGPTGSGKTTALYALLHELRDTGRSIVTIEDPVEYIIDGITQIQVQKRQGLTFAEGARGILRLDPDAILMGELREAESARVALDIADTGHLFLSSLHARDAVATISALRNFGLADFEIAASVDLIIAERLVRRLCRKCRRLERTDDWESRWLEQLGQPVPKECWHAVGCPECSRTGYRGRIGIFEVWRLNEEEADLILRHTDEHTLRRRLRKRGMSSLLEDDLAKVGEGVTTLAELRSVGGFGFYDAPGNRHDG